MIRNKCRECLMLFKVIKHEMKSQAPLYIFYGNNNKLG